MRLAKITSVGLFAILVLQAAGFAEAQHRDPRSPANRSNYDVRRRPTISRYFDLLRPGGSIGFNYHTLVRPRARVGNEISNQRRNEQRLGNEAGNLRQRLDEQRRLLEKQQAGQPSGRQGFAPSPFTPAGNLLTTGASQGLPATGLGGGTSGLRPTGRSGGAARGSAPQHRGYRF